MTGYKPFFPDQAYPQLYADVMQHQLFPDSKTFADCVAKISPEQIVTLYNQVNRQDENEVARFVEKWFDFPFEETLTPIPQDSILEHLQTLWDYLVRLPDPVHQYSSLIPLPHSYVVPGGRFREIYYWDSYFTMLGLRVSERSEIIYDMVSNFAWMLGQTGQIPNGSRSYFLSRSQPPFFAFMIELLAEIEGEHIYTTYLTELLIEYSFWMKVPEGKHQDEKRVIRIGDHSLNRYYDELDQPRPESYAEDVQLTSQIGSREGLYRDLRAACESGWDFSSRWLKDNADLGSIHTTEIIPVDLNSLLFCLEQCISRAFELTNDSTGKQKFEALAQNRIDAMNAIMWNEKDGYFGDYNFVTKSFGKPSLAIMFPLFAGIATTRQAQQTAAYLKEHFLRDGGYVTTEFYTGQQWDAPNGWAPLQWITYVGLKNYGEENLANEGAFRWLALNKKVFDRTGRMMEKYNVEDLTLEAGGGEYPVQDGFGWTNGVYLALTEEVNKSF